MRVVRGDRYAETSARILDALADTSRVDPARIDAALEAEHRRWVAFQFDRLRRFGYSFAMY